MYCFLGNFATDEIGEPILDVILEAGDLLYFPRGTIHQGRTLDDAHSMHITVSCCQKNTWADFFEKVMFANDAALTKAIVSVSAVVKIKGDSV